MFTAVLTAMLLGACGSGGSMQGNGSGGTQDLVPPVGGEVRDGIGDDVDRQPDVSSLSANWDAFVDDGSGVAGYEWGIGTAPGGADVRDWTRVGADRAATAGGLSLQRLTTYYVSVRAWDRAGNVSDPVSSDGVTIDEFARTLTQFGITWQFDSEKRVGRFANGDWWVIGPVSIIGISPPSVSGSRIKNGSMVNPDPAVSRQGYDSSAAHVTYERALNVALDVTESSPLHLAPNSSLISTISRDEAGGRPQLRAAAVLTVLDQAAPEGSFRPPYAGTDKSIRFHTSQLDQSRLLSLEPVAGAPSLADVERAFERPWIDHIGGWGGADIHPSENMPDYGREMASAVGDAALMLHLDFAAAQKSRLLVRYVQLGIDLYGIVANGGVSHWVPNGGHASGRKWPILFAGILLDDAEMAAIGTRQDIYFGEDAQTFYVRETSPGVYNHGHGGYTAQDEGLPEWGIRHATTPSLDDRSWGATYRQCCTANAWVGYVLAARLMNVQGLWGHDALFDYQDRYMQAQVGAAPHMRSWSTFAGAMWDRYR